MAKSSTDTLHGVINAAVVDAIVALKGASNGLPNALLRDLNAIHANTAFADLPEAVQKAVSASVRNAFTELRKEGYVVADSKSVQAAGAPHQPRPPQGPKAYPSRGRSSTPPKRRPPTSR